MTVTENVILGRAAGVRLDLDAARGDASWRPRSASASPCARTPSWPGPLGRRAAARRDRQGARARLPRPHPRRADRRARAAGGRGPLRDAAASRRRRPRGRLHQPQARRGARHQRPRQRAAPRTHGRARAPGATDERELARMMVGRPTFGVGRQDGLRRRRRAAAPRRASLSAHRRPRPPGAARRRRWRSHARRDRRRRRRLRQRPDGARRGALGHARRRRPGRSSSTAWSWPAPARTTSWPPASGRIPEDRHASLVLDLSVALNLVLEHIDDFRVGGRPRPARASRRTPGRSSTASRSRPGRSDRVGTLSGGNIQKVLLARVLVARPAASSSSRSPRAASTSAPPSTSAASSWRGAPPGAAILLVSEDLDELLSLVRPPRRALRGARRRPDGGRGGRSRAPRACSWPGEAAGRMMARGRRAPRRTPTLGRRTQPRAWRVGADRRSRSLLTWRSAPSSSPAPAPIDAYLDYFVTPLTPQFRFLEVLVSATPLLFTGVAVAIAFRAGYWNIGVEGQLLMGAVAAAGVGQVVGGLAAVVALPLMVAAGALAGAAWALVPALLRVRLGIDEVVTTLLLNPVALLVVEALLHGPWRTPRPASRSRRASPRPPSCPSLRLPALPRAVPSPPRLRHRHRHHRGRLVGPGPDGHRACGCARWASRRMAARFAGIRVERTLLRRRPRQRRHRGHRRRQRGGRASSTASPPASRPATATPASWWPCSAA